MKSRGSSSKKRDALIGRATSLEDIVDALARRGCLNLTPLIDLDACGKLPLAGGGFCDVFQGRLNDGTMVAIKSLRVYDRPGRDNDKQKILKRAAREIYHWSRLKHPNVLPLEGLAIFRGHMSMVSQWMYNGDLMSYIRLKPDSNRVSLCTDVCAGLCHIHAEGMVHGDLKAANVMVSLEGMAMIADFGNSQLKDLTLRFTNTTNLSHSLRWTAPELLREDDSPHVSKEADVYAYGMTTLETLTGKVPFDGLKDNRIVGLVAYEHRVPARPEVGISDDLWNMMMSCWTHEPAKRPTIASIKERIQVLNDRSRERLQDEASPTRQSGAERVQTSEKEERYLNESQTEREGGHSAGSQPTTPTLPSDEEISTMHHKPTVILPEGWIPDANDEGRSSLPPAHEIHPSPLLRNIDLGYGESSQHPLVSNTPLFNTSKHRAGPQPTTPYTPLIFPSDDEIPIMPDPPFDPMVPRTPPSYGRPLDVIPELSSESQPTTTPEAPLPHQNRRARYSQASSYLRQESDPHSSRQYRVDRKPELPKEREGPTTIRAGPYHIGDGPTHIGAGPSRVPAAPQIIIPGPPPRPPIPGGTYTPYSPNGTGVAYGNGGNKRYSYTAATPVTPLSSQPPPTQIPPHEPWNEPSNPRRRADAEDAAMSAHARALEQARKLQAGESDDDEEELVQRLVRSRYGDQSGQNYSGEDEESSEEESSEEESSEEESAGKFSGESEGVAESRQPHARLHEQLYDYPNRERDNQSQGSTVPTILIKTPSNKSNASSVESHVIDGETLNPTYQPRPHQSGLEHHDDPYGYETNSLENEPLDLEDIPKASDSSHNYFPAPYDHVPRGSGSGDFSPDFGPDSLKYDPTASLPRRSSPSGDPNTIRNSSPWRQPGRDSANSFARESSRPSPRVNITRPGPQPTTQRASNASRAPPAAADRSSSTTQLPLPMGDVTSGPSGLGARLAGRLGPGRPSFLRSSNTAPPPVLPPVLPAATTRIPFITSSTRPPARAPAASGPRPDINWVRNTLGPSLYVPMAEVGSPRRPPVVSSDPLPQQPKGVPLIRPNSRFTDRNMNKTRLQVEAFQALRDQQDLERQRQWDVNHLNVDDNRPPSPQGSVRSRKSRAVTVVSTSDEDDWTTGRSLKGKPL